MATRKQAQAQGLKRYIGARTSALAVAKCLVGVSNLGFMI
jgi:hypothetical protein